MKMIKGVLLGILIAMPVAGFAANTNVTYKSSIALGATYKSGNSDKTLFTMDLKGDRYSPKNDWLNSLYAEYGKTGTSTTPKTQTEGKARGQSDWKHKFGGKNFYGGMFGEVLTDAIKQIRFRGKLGPNLGYYWINKDTHKF
ncbi:MAG: DUF481 domain-containing protein, partial [Pontiella sp.]